MVRTPVINYKLWAALLIVFFSGLLIGALGVWMTMEHRAFDMLTGHRRGLEQIILRKLDHRLHLTDSQRTSLEKILCRTQQEMMEVRRQHRPEMDRIFQKSFADIRAELTPEQQQKFDVLHQEFKERRDRWLSGKGWSHGGHSLCE